MRYQVIEWSHEDQRERFSLVLAIRGEGLTYGADVAHALEVIAEKIRLGAVRGTVYGNDAKPIGRWGFGGPGLRQVS